MVLEPELEHIKADPGQIEQVLMNLAVNARDAMPNGGRLTIETANVDLDKRSVRKYPSVTPGPHILLSVSDTGSGMDTETQAHRFEPFCWWKMKRLFGGWPVVFRNAAATRCWRHATEWRRSTFPSSTMDRSASWSRMW